MCLRGCCESLLRSYPAVISHLENAQPAKQAAAYSPGCSEAEPWVASAICASPCNGRQIFVCSNVAVARFAGSGINPCRSQGSASLHPGLYAAACSAGSLSGLIGGCGLAKRDILFVLDRVGWKWREIGVTRFTKANVALDATRPNAQEVAGFR